MSFILQIFIELWFISHWLCRPMLNWLAHSATFGQFFATSQFLVWLDRRMRVNIRSIWNFKIAFKMCQGVYSSIFDAIGWLFTEIWQKEKGVLFCLEIGNWPEVSAWAKQFNIGLHNQWLVNQISMKICRIKLIVKMLFKSALIWKSYKQSKSGSPYKQTFAKNQKFASFYAND